MPSLITPQEFEEIYDSIRDVTDTLFTTEVTYRLSKPKIDRYGEGQNNGSTASFDDKVMNCMVEYGKQAIDGQVIGSANFQDVVLTFNSEEWLANGLYANGVLATNGTKDYVIVNGRTYKVSQIQPDGPFETQNVLIIVMANLQPQITV